MNGSVVILGNDADRATASEGKLLLSSILGVQCGWNLSPKGYCLDQKKL